MGTDAIDPTPPPSRPLKAGPRGRTPQLWTRLLELVPQSGDGFEILDCGGGSGSLAVPLASHGARVTVVDVSIDALSTFLRRATEAGVSDRVIAVQGEAESLTQLGLAEGGYDLVLAHDVLSSVSSPADALRQIAATVRPGGAASVVIANPVAVVLGRVLAGDVTGALAAFHRTADQAYDLNSLLSDAANAGLQVESIQGLGAFTELVPGIDLERPGAVRALAELEQAAADAPPYRDIASRLHVVARRPD